MEATICMRNRLYMWLKYTVSVFRRFSTRYFGICHFFLRYCGIGYPPMSPSWWPAQLCNENIQQLTAIKIYLTKYFFSDISQTYQWRSSLQLSPRKSYQVPFYGINNTWGILYNRLKFVTLIRQYVEDWMLKFHEPLSLSWRQVVITR